MTSRDEILALIRRNRPAPAELPTLQHSWTSYADRRQQFINVLESVGGRAIVANRDTLRTQIESLPEYSSAQRIVALVPELGAADDDIAHTQSPHDLADVDLAILPGEFAVAENAAVWVTDRSVPRVLYFLCQHLVLVVPAGQIVDHMHAAYERLTAATFSTPAFGVFISGPSKTADIEQSLVIGAHGPRSLTVCLLEER